MCPHVPADRGPALQRGHVGPVCPEELFHTVPRGPHGPQGGLGRGGPRSLSPSPRAPLPPGSSRGLGPVRPLLGSPGTLCPGVPAALRSQCAVCVGTIGPPLSREEELCSRQPGPRGPRGGPEAPRSPSWLAGPRGLLISRRCPGSPSEHECARETRGARRWACWESRDVYVS